MTTENKMNKQQSPRLRFKGFMGEWEAKELSDIFEISSASRVLKEQWQKEGVPFFRTSDVIAAFKGESNEKAFISFELFDDLTKKSGQPQKDDLLVTGGGSIGIPYLIENDQPIYFKDADLLWLKSAGKINGKFLFYSFLSDNFKRYLKSISHTGTISHYTIIQAKSTPIELPSEPEQTQLGNFFRDLDRLLAESRAVWEKSRQLKKAMLAKMFPASGKKIPEIRFKGFEGEWESRRLGDIGNTFGGLTNKSREDFGHGDACYITYMNVYQNALSSIEQLDRIEIDAKQNEVKKGDVLFTTSSETPEEVGMSSVWTFDIDNVYLNSFCFGYRLNEKIDLNYLAYCLRSDYVRSQMILLAQGISRYNISKKGVMEIEILIPSPKEQTAIGNFFRQLDETIAPCKRQKSKN